MAHDSNRQLIDLAAAALAATAIGVGVHLLLQVATRAAAGAAPSPGSLGASLLDWSPWLAGAVVLRLSAPLIRQDAIAERRRDPQSRPEAFDLVGLLFMAVPLAWMAGTVLVRLVAAPTIGHWDVDGRPLLEVSYYADLLTAGLPWMLAGASVRALARHL